MPDGRRGSRQNVPRQGPQAERPAQILVWRGDAVLLRTVRIAQLPSGMGIFGAHVSQSFSGLSCSTKIVSGFGAVHLVWGAHDFELWLHRFRR